MLNLESIKKMLSMPELGERKAVLDVLDAVPPGGKSVVLISKCLTVPMSNKQIMKATGLSLPTVTLVIRFMRHYGDVTTSGGAHTVTGTIHTPTGSNHLFEEYKSKVRPTSNMGVTGVSFIKSTNNFHCCYGRNISLYANNFLDAVCIRKSLESKNMESSLCLD